MSLFLCSLIPFALATSAPINAPVSTTASRYFRAVKKSMLSNRLLIVQHELCNTVHSQLSGIQLQLACANLVVAQRHVLVQHVHGNGVLAQILEELVHACHNLGLADVVTGTVRVAVLTAQSQLTLVTVVVLCPVGGVGQHDFFQLGDEVGALGSGNQLLFHLAQRKQGLTQAEGQSGTNLQDADTVGDHIVQALGSLVVGGVALEAEVGILLQHSAQLLGSFGIVIEDLLVAEFHTGLNDHGDDILDFFVKAERDRAIKYQTHYRERAVGQKVKEKFGCDIVIPKGLTRIKEAENFMWIANSNIDIQQNIVIYSYPYTDKNTFTKEYLTAKRDSIMKLHVEGPAENSYMGTEYRYDPPIMKETALKSGQYATELRGLWSIVGDIMGGPFVSVSCLDEENQRVITAECFVYAPGKNKRNILRNLESVLYTIKFEKNEQH